MKQTTKMAGSNDNEEEDEDEDEGEEDLGYL